jgi:3-deoxy-7-phosphoheptulonate synthase
LVSTLNPDNTPGRLTLIARMGHDKVSDLLGPLVEALQADGASVLWTSDPMHGNTFKAAGGIKTRRFDDILSEVTQFFAVHQSLGTWPGGLHVELTGSDVTECLGGGHDLTESDLTTNYTSICDPRLNACQGLDMAFRVAELLQRAGSGARSL